MRAQVGGMYLCQLHTGWVPQDGSIRLLVAGIADELGVPDSEIMLAVDPLGKYGDGRPVVERGGTPSVKAGLVLWEHTGKGVAHVHFCMRLRMGPWSSCWKRGTLTCPSVGPLVWGRVEAGRSRVNSLKEGECFPNGTCKQP